MKTILAWTPASKQPQGQCALAFTGLSGDHPQTRSVKRFRATKIQIPPSPFHPSIAALKRLAFGRQRRMSDPNVVAPTFFTPVRPSMTHYPMTIPTTVTGRRVRPLSDREALWQMLMHAGMSVRKKVLESGKKPRNLTSNNVLFETIASLCIYIGRGERFEGWT